MSGCGDKNVDDEDPGGDDVGSVVDPFRKTAIVIALAALSFPGTTAANAAEFKQYHQDVKINASRQDAANNGAGVRVGVIDTDIDLNHPEYADRVVEIISEPNYPYFPPGNHGTQVTGIIAAARDGRGVVGIAPEAEIVSAWYLDHDGDAIFPPPSGSLVPWAQALSEQNVNVINASLGPAGGSLPEGRLEIDVADEKQCRLRHRRR